MAKLTGAKKAAFLKRMAAGRRKAAAKSRAPISPTKRRKAAPKRKTIKQKKSSKTVPAKKKGILDNIPLIRNPTFKKAAVGVGTATIGAAVISFVAPSIATHPLVKPILAFAGGGVPGVVAQIVAQRGIGGLTGSNGGGMNAGFA